jgi:hypothetical protein
MPMTDRQVLRGFLANIDSIPPLILTFQFNPTKVSDNKVVKYAEGKAGLCGRSPGKVYTGGGDRTISFTIQLDGLEQGSNALNPTGLDNGISTELAKLRSFLYPKSDAWGSISELLGDTDQGRRMVAPPTCIFGYGTKILDCVVTSITIDETMFNSFLAPVRAQATITLTVIEVEGNTLFELDNQHRNLLAALGVQNISVV